MLRNNLEKIRLEMSVAQGQEITQIEFADMLGVGQSQYNRWARQKLQPTLEKAIMISERLNKSINDIFYIISEKE